jgi:hypothetical protein
LFALIVLWTAGIGPIDREAKEEMFLRAKDSPDGYLIPVLCDRAPGIPFEDYIFGHVAVDGIRKGRDVCLYTRPAYNKLFPYMIAGDPATAHRRQANSIGANLKYPSKLGMIYSMVFVSVIWTLVFGSAAYFTHRSNRRR